MCWHGSVINRDHRQRCGTDIVAVLLDEKKLIRSLMACQDADGFVSAKKNQNLPSMGPPRS